MLCSAWAVAGRRAGEGKVTGGILSWPRRERESAAGGQAGDSARLGRRRQLYGVVDIVRRGE